MIVVVVWSGDGEWISRDEMAIEMRIRLWRFVESETVYSYSSRVSFTDLL